MAKNWTTYEAVKVIHEGTDFESISDILRRFPVFGVMALKVNDGGVEIMRALPEYITARKINSFFKKAYGLVDDSDADSDDEVAEEKPAKVEKAKKASKKVVEEDDDEEEEAPKKKAPKKAAKKAKPVEEDEDDEEEEEPAPKKKAAKKTTKKSKPVEDDDDDDDFDFDD